MTRNGREAHKPYTRACERHARPWLAILLVLVTAPVTARPAPDFLDEEVGIKRRPRCPSNSDWSKLKRCLETQDKLVMLQDRPNAKLVRLHGKSTSTPTVFLFVRVDGQWLRTAFYGETSVNGELLSFAPIADDAYRLEMGHAYATSVALDEITSQPAVLRQKVTSVCTAKGECHSVVTLCELSVHGKAYFWFRGKPVWDGTTLRTSGATANTGTHCHVPPAQLSP